MQQSVGLRCLAVRLDVFEGHAVRDPTPLPEEFLGSASEATEFSIVATSRGSLEGDHRSRPAAQYLDDSRVITETVTSPIAASIASSSIGGHRGM
jgi:hypothetical protein